MSHENQENYDDYNGDHDNKYDQQYDESSRGDDFGGYGRGGSSSGRGRGFNGPPGGAGSFFGVPPAARGRGGPGMAPPGFAGRGRGFATPGMSSGFAPRGRGMPPGRGGYMPPYRGGYGVAPNGGPGAYGGPYNGGPGAYGAQAPGPNPQDQEQRLKRLSGCEEGQELWVETETAEGKKYFYHPVNRNTIWERPQNAKIVTQPELAQLIHRATEEEKNREERMPHGQIPQNPDDAWNEFNAPDGRKYYFNSITQENTWEKPKALIDQENGGGASPEPVQSAAIAEAQAKAQAALAAFMAQQKTSSNGGGGMPLSKAQASGAAAAAAVNAEAAKKKDSTRPISSTPVSGTPWCVVWTGDDKVFFYNPSTKCSVWERPPDTYGREDVDKLVQNPPSPKAEEENNQSKKESESESESDEDGPPKAKKSRAEKKKEALIAAQKKEKERPRQMLQKPVDPAIEAEMQAAKEREKVPLEERLKQFKEMLEEKNVSTSSTFEKELSKIVFDKRYLSLGATERRACFDAFCREKIESEKAERRKRVKEAKEEFQKLLAECELNGRSSYSSFTSKFGKDPRYKAVERNRDREDAFNDFVGELHKKEKDEKRAKKEKLKAAFVKLLEEQTGLTRKSKWSTTKKTLEDEERYIALDSSSTRESLFREFVANLGDETASDIEEEQEREKRLAAQTAIANRQKEVEAELGNQLRERTKESEKQKMGEHEDTYRNLLIDLIKSTENSWHEARRILRKDERYANCDMLDKTRKESLFDDHIKSLERKRREAFFQVLDNHEKITPMMRWSRNLAYQKNRYSMADEDILVDGRPLSSLKVTELKEELENRQLSTKGVKAVLQERLREALAAQGDDPVVDEQNPIVAGYLARQSAALAEARKRTESEASGTTTPQSEVSPSKQSEASPRKGRTPRKEKKDVEPEAEPEPEADIAPEPEKVAIVEKPEPKPEPITETEASPSKASEKDAAVEVSVEKVDAETAQESDSPQEAEKEKTEPQVELENGGQEEDEPDRDESIEKQPEKEDDGDELDYGDDEEKEQKDDESMDAEDAKEEKVVQIEKEKKEDKDDGVKKEEKVREVSRRRVSSPSSRHPVSNVVHIRGLTRPFTEGQLRAEIQKNCGEIVDLWMDKVKSHCFVKLNSDADAGNVISAMNNVVWPDGNPKRLSIVYDTEDNLIKHRNGLEATIAEPAKIGGGRADRLSTTSQSSILGGKTNFQITMQNVLRDNDKLDSERKRERGSIQSRLTRIENKDQVKDEKKDEKKEDRKRKRSETPPFSRGAGFMDEKKARNEERERRREGPRSEERRKVVVEEEEAPKKSLDQLFKKTVALPPIYYLPLTEEQIAAKEAEKSAKGKERAETTSDRDRPHRVDRNDRGDRPRHRD